jgi:hypothetical protein
MKSKLRIQYYDIEIIDGNIIKEFKWNIFNIQFDTTYKILHIKWCPS